MNPEQPASIHATRSFCEEAEKVSFISKHDARRALVGQMASKSVRIYPCPYHKGHFHLTKEYQDKVRHGAEVLRTSGKKLRRR